jgi:hypothetical protein
VQEASDAARVEPCQVDRAARVELPQESPADHEPGDREEDVDTRGSASKMKAAGIEEDEQDRDSPKTLDVGAPLAPRAPLEI